ncbi:MAG TPA: bifunctional anthranilate synthase component I family protein/class IV aminotransferase, partial [Woeseiaceae bacterium]
RRVQSEGLFAAGYVSYEASPGFDAACVTQRRGALPLVCLGLFREPDRPRQLPRPEGPGVLHQWSFSGTRENYLATVGKIKRQIEVGNTYQVNYTIRQHAREVHDAWALFLAMATDAPYAAYIDCGDHAIVSASPELFFELKGDRLLCRPMKGTAPRGMTAAEDKERRCQLHESAKDRAENVMIADMVRNDLGRIAMPGSVQTPSLYDIEKYRTVWQMTSTVTASTKSSVCDVLRALFPSASVTGAPKVASMKLIAALEDSPREVDTGAIGYLGPGRHARFNVAIRTAVIDRRTRTGVYGVGGGIVWDSNPEDEFQECVNKARVLAETRAHTGFSLLETMLWTADRGFLLLDEHLARLEASAGYFDFPFNRAAIEAELAATGVAQAPGQKYRLRLLMARNGDIQTEVQALCEGDAGRQWRLALANSPVDTRDAFLYHKTTRRDVYENALAAAGNCDDVLLWNEDGYITETGIGNVVVRLAGRLWTPPVECGLLAGTFRGKLLREGVLGLRKVAVTELAEAEAIFLINSVRGWISCRLAHPETDFKRASSNGATGRSG